MNDEQRTRPILDDGTHRALSRSAVIRFILLSTIIGILLHVLALLWDTLRYPGTASKTVNFDSLWLLRNLEDFVRGFLRMGLVDGSVFLLGWFLRYFLLGAVIVIPIWLIIRLVRAPSSR
jgi:hypothetical protein